MYGAPWQVKFAGSHTMCRNPLSALATIMPVSPVVMSWMVVVNPPGVSYRLTTSSSPGFMTRTSGVGVKVCSVAVSGPGGPIGRRTW